MSYILDALKKSDQERKQGDVPNLQTVHVPVVPEQKSAWPMYTLILFLLMSLAFVIGVMISEKKEAVLISDMKQEGLPAPHVQNEVKVSEIRPVVEEKKIDPVKPEFVIVKEEIAKASPRQEITPTMAVASESQSILDSEISEIAYLHELDGYQQQLIPEMNFAGHVYSSVATNRSVIINGRAMSEGESVMQGMTVEKITTNGVVFRFNGILFRVDVLQDWSFE